MKGKWKLCMVSGSIMVFAVLGALILVQAVMSSADRKERVFELAEGAARQSVSGSAASGGASSKEAVSSGEEADRKKSERPLSSRDKKGEEEDEIPDITDVSCGFSKDEDSLGERIAAYAESMQGVPKEEVVLVPVKEDGDVRYYRDENQVHYVPKRALEEILL